MADVVAKIKLADGKDLSVTKSFISSIKSVSESTTDAGSINYGTLSNTGSMEIQDGNGYISKLIENGSLPISDLDVKVEFNGETFQHHITTDSDYNTEDNTLNVSLSNFVKDFDILKYKGYPYPDSSRSLYDLFFDVLNSYFKTTKDVIDSMFDDDVLEYIKEISVEYPVIEYGKTYRKILDELCTIAQINMFATKENSLRFMSARPVYTPDENIKKLNWGNIVEDLKYTKTLKNKFDGVEMSSAKVIDSNEYNTVIDKITIDTSTLVDDDLFTRGNGGGGGHMVLVNDVGYPYTWYAGAVYSYVWGEYADYSKKFVKKIKNNLEQILSVSNRMFSDEEKKYPNFKIFYKKVEKATTGTFNLTGMTLDSLNLVNWEYKDFTNSDFENVDVETGYDLTQETKINYNDPYGTKMTISQTAKIEDLSEMAVSDIGDRFELEIEAILCGFQKLSLSFLGGTDNFESVKATGTVTKYKPIRVELTLYGDKRVIEFEESPDSSDDIENKKTKASVQSSNLLQQGTLYKNETQISSIIKQNILSDYRRGISDGSLVLNDNIVEIGDLVKYPQDSRTWRVVGKEFNYDGDYLFPISVMQCLLKPSGYGVYDNEGNLLYDWNDIVETGVASVDNGTITSFDKTIEGNLTIPNNITSIGSNAFSDSKLTKISLPESLQTIGVEAFRYCQNITEITIPNTVSNVGASAFRQCSSLKLLNIGQNITEIPNAMCWGCSNLKTVNIQGSISKIGSNAFEGCRSLVFEIPSSVTQINDYAFYDCRSISSITIPSGVEQLGAWAFASCSKVNSVNLTNNITRIGKGCFADTTALKSITIPTSLLFIQEQLFISSGLTSITIPTNIKFIGSNAFAGCENLTSAKFNSPSGWVTSSGETLNLSNTSTNALYLRETYAGQEWTQY